MWKIPDNRNILQILRDEFAPPIVLLLMIITLEYLKANTAFFAEFMETRTYIEDGWNLMRLILGLAIIGSLHNIISRLRKRDEEE